MKTQDLIKAMAADKTPAGLPLAKAWWLALFGAVVIAGIVFFSAMHIRRDFGEVVHSLRFLFKFAVTLTLAASAFALLRRLSRPGARVPTVWLLTAPLLLLAGVGLELISLAPELWEQRLLGRNSLQCLVFIPLIGIGPLAVFLATVRQGAPTRPHLTGAVAGLLAGGVAATFYATHCIDDSPLFVMIWYSLAVTGLAALGALLAPRLTRW